MIKRLRLKFICITMVLLTVMMSILLYSQLNFTQSSLMQIKQEALEDASRDYLNDLEKNKPEVPAREKPEKEKPDITRPGEHPCFILSLDSQGNPVATGSRYFKLNDEAVLLDIYQQTADKARSTGVLWDYELHYLREETYFVFTDITSELETMREMARNSVLIWILGFLAFLILSIFLANWAIRPVEQAWEQQRQFVADASHDLKTPLTVILTNAELLEEGLENTQQQRFASSIVTVSRQMRDLVEDMLRLARADVGRNESQREKLDLSRLTEQVLLPMEPMFFEAGLRFDSAIEPDVAVKGDAAGLRQVVGNLLDNALKYSAPGGSVVLTLKRQGRYARLSVASQGQTLTAQQCRDIFKRFYRLDPARSRSGGNGLGLSIAGHIVADHRGKIWAKGRDGINTFYVNLPLN